MSFLKRKDFSERYGVKPGTLRVHIKREKVIESDGFIDTEHPTNKIYIQENATKVLEAEPVVETLIKKTQESKTDTIAAPPRKSKKDYEGNAEYLDLTMRQKKAQVNKTEREAEYKRLQNLKLQGKLIPIDQVGQIQSINIQSIFRAMESTGENLISICMERMGGDRADLAWIVTQFREELQRQIDSAKEKSKDEIMALIDEYAETRSRGERK